MPSSLNGNAVTNEWDFLDSEASFVDAGVTRPSCPTSTELKNAPIIMHPALKMLQKDANNSQYALFGQVMTAWYVLLYTDISGL
jgi:hypothetical protein